MIKIALNESKRTVAQYMEAAVEAGVPTEQIKTQEQILRVLDKAKFLILDGDAEKIYNTMLEEGYRQIRKGAQTIEGVKYFSSCVIQKVLFLFAMEEIKAGREKKPHRKIRPEYVAHAWRYCAENWNEVRGSREREDASRKKLGMEWNGYRDDLITERTPQ